ncbi:MAG: hypothetical protein J2O44_03035 [Porphyrobacter sp.]|nr:hypothetical protein [Porphyrobacter sp.]
MTEQALSARPAGKRSWSDIGLAVMIVLTVPLAMIVEALSVIMAENAAGWREYAVLALFAAPLVTAWAAIGISLASRPVWLRTAVAALVLLVPPVLLFGAFNV